MAKSATFGVMHLGIAFGVSYALTGNVAIAGAITLVEPVVNTVAHYFFDRWWARREQCPQAQPPAPEVTGVAPGANSGALAV
jgi:uncharacterized membrane protein